MTTTKPKPPAMFPRQPGNHAVRGRVGLIIAIIGLVTFLLGTEPAMFGLDRSPVTGFVQIAVFLVGLALISMGGYLGLTALWQGQPVSLLADIGSRLVSTGYVVSVASGMADVFGFGSEALPSIPTFGIWQQRGVLFGMAIIAVGFLLMIRWQRTPTVVDEA